MEDQAAKLRDLVQNMKFKQEKEEEKENINISGNNSYIYTVTSGKGGVGKSNFTVNLALALTELGKRVAIFDADLGMANLDVILGVTPRYNLEHVIRGEVLLKDIIVKGPKGLSLIPGGSGIEELANLSQRQINNLLQGFSKIGQYYDVIVVDTGAGLANNVINFILGSDEVILISTPEPTSITDAYGVIKVISNNDKQKKINLIINQMQSQQEGERVSNRLITTAREFLGIDVNLLGLLPYDEQVIRSVMKRRPFLLEFPRAKITRSINQIAAKLINRDFSQESKGIKGFFSKLLGL